MQRNILGQPQGKIASSPTLLRSMATSSFHPFRSFALRVLRGLGQVMLQNHAGTGLLFVLGIALNAPVFAGAALLGAALGTASAQALGVPDTELDAGLWGFNGALIAIALLFFLQANAWLWVCVLLAVTSGTVLAAAMQRFWSQPGLTAPFVWVSWCFFLASARFGRLESSHLLPSAGLPQAATVEGVVSASTIAQGLLHGVAQVFFQENLWTGAVFLLGLLLASRKAALLAVLGSLSGALIAWALGAAEPAIRAGAFGFNSVLVAIALQGVFLAAGWRSACYTALALLATPLVLAALSAALQPLGLPAMTMPFVLVVWGFLLAKPVFASLKSAEHG